MEKIEKIEIICILGIFRLDDLWNRDETWLGSIDIFMIVDIVFMMVMMMYYAYVCFVLVEGYDALMLSVRMFWKIRQQTEVCGMLDYMFQ